MGCSAKTELSSFYVIRCWATRAAFVSPFMTKSVVVANVIDVIVAKTNMMIPATNPRQPTK